MKIAVMGFGTVGSGVVEVLTKNNDVIVKSSLGQAMDLGYILDIRDFPGSPYEKYFTKNFNDIISDPEVKIVVETMGGVTFAYDYVKQALLSGRSVVTSNKQLVAEKGYELLQIADKKNVNFMFEASVGGGIPIIAPLTECLTANRIEEVAGILNGTTNYILTQMIDNGVDFSQALKEAQDLGYAEKDPTSDIEGYDACRKICILASLCYGKHIYPEDVSTEGIKDVTLNDVAYAKKCGCQIKLIGSSKPVEGGHITASVAPAFIKDSSILADVHDVFNAIMVRGDALGDVVFYGRGAGKMPTASAVVADVIDCAKHLLRKRAFGWGAPEKGFVVSDDYLTSRMYFRAETNDYSSSEKEIKDKFPEAEILSDGSLNEIAFMTDAGNIGELKNKAESVENMNIKMTMRLMNLA